jgi:alginate O-acetyltransferase complex protein AlgI
MLFNSFQYLIFFPIVVGVYFAIPHRYRWILLLLASYYFYACWKAEYLILILASTLVDYFSGIMMGKTAQKRKRKKYLIISLASNIGLLLGFKYFNFFSSSVQLIINQFNIFVDMPTFHVLLPVGISFYTFQTLSYSIDVYNGTRGAEKHLGMFALYVAFFPQLVAGPIERSTRLLPALSVHHNFEYKRVTDGLRLVLWGMFKKVAIADRLAVLVNQVYNNPENYAGPEYSIATIFFAFQIYCDFSGYSDIAIGSAQVMGYPLTTNFRRPYFSKSIAEFWRRWHISLSTWFRDYVYFPLGGSRVRTRRLCFNLLAVFLISGLWHGAKLTFVIWGAVHGFYLVFSVLTKNIRHRISEMIGMKRKPNLVACSDIIVTFTLINLAWIIFRANSTYDAMYIISHLHTGWGHVLSLSGIHESILSMDVTVTYFVLSLVMIVCMESIHLMQAHGSVRQMIESRPIWIRWSCYYLLIFCILLSDYNMHEFIYFQF